MSPPEPGARTVPPVPVLRRRPVPLAASALLVAAGVTAALLTAEETGAGRGIQTRTTELSGIDAWTSRAEHALDAFDHHGHWTPLDRLRRARREKVDADLGELVERLADVAALTDVRRTA